MESLSRPPHRRKHSATAAVAADAFSNFARKNPYDDVLLSRGGKGRALETQEYNEIFAGSPSSIPVLDLSGLDERAGSADGLISALDYSNIFGGLRNDAVAAPYEELVNGSAKSAKPRIRMPADSQPLLRQPGSSHFTGNARRLSEETSNQSVNGVKQQFNVSFNKSNQRDSDASTAKSHIAQLHSVPGFTFFVDETPQKQKVEDHKLVPPLNFVDETPQKQKAEDHKTVPLLKRDVSRTWSFSAEVEDVKGKRGVSSEKSCIPDVSHNRNEANTKTKVPLSSNYTSNPSNSKEPKRARASNVAPKVDASKKIPGEYSLPFLDEEFDENSVAAASAAALKKAVEQAQESIRLAKLKKERKKAGHEDRSKTKSHGRRLKDLGKDIKIDDEVYGSKENISGKVFEELDAGLMGVGGKHSPSLLENDTLPNAEVEAAQKVEPSKGHGEGFSWRGLLFGLSSSQSNGRNATLGSESGGNNDVSVVSMSKLEPDLGRMEIGKETLEQRDIVVSHAGRGVLNAPQRMQDLEKSVEEPELYQATFNHAKGPEAIVEPLGRVHDTSRRALEQENVVEEDDENWRAGLEEQVTEKRENDMDDVQRHDKIPEEREDTDGVEQLTAEESVFDIFLNQSRKMMGSETNDASGCKEDELDDIGAYDGEHKMGWREAHISVESKEHLGKALEEEVNVIEPSVREIGNKVEACEAEADKKHSHSHDGDEPNLPGKVEQDKVVGKCENTSECDANESQFIEAINLAKHEALWDVQETNSMLGETGRSVEDDYEERCENIPDYEADEKREVEADDFAEVQKNDIFWDVEETKSTHRGTGSSEENYNEERHENASEHGADGSRAPEADSFIEVQKSDLFWNVDGTNVSVIVTERRSGESRNEPKPEVNSEHGLDDSRVMEASDYSEVLENEPIWDVEETNSSHGETGRSEEHHNVFKFQDAAAYEEHADEVMEASNFAEVPENEPIWDLEETNSSCGETGRSEEHHNVFKFQDAAAYVGHADKVDGTKTGGASTVFNDTEETCGVDLNNIAEQYQEAVNTNVGTETLPAVVGSQNDKDIEAEQSFHLGDNAMPGLDNSHQSGNEGINVESSQNNASEGGLASSDSKTEYVGITEAVSKESSREDEHESKIDSGIHGTAQYYADNNSSDYISSDNGIEEFELTDERPVSEQTADCDEGSVSTHGPEETDRLSTHESEGHAENVKYGIPRKEATANGPEVSNERKFTEEQSKGLCSPSQNEPKETDKSMEATSPEETSSNIENNENLNGTTMGERDSKESMQQRIEVIKRAREREKERLAVERAIREARERAFAEARERAGKAAEQRATAGVQQRVLTEAQGKLEKASAVKQPTDKASIEVKLRAERVAVERVTAEVRGRALEKAMSQKTSTETRTLADRNNVLKHSFSSSDLETTTATESAQRRKARLERHHRTMERAAKALAEKNKRDLLAQKEQAERNRLAEFLDADIKRWATGKEGNLRALISTLQYILGRDSGWQPIPLTEMLTTAAVKKAYRKATLYVHPDKLQQRGASIRQKYICEKIFDLLKAAWNKFNSEER